MESSFSDKKNVWIESKPKPYLRKEDTFLQILVNVSEAVENFVRQYESKYSVTIFDYELQKLQTVASYFLAGVVRLNFTFQRGEEHFASSVILKVPQLGDFQRYAELLFLYIKERYIYKHIIPLIYQSWTGRKAVPECFGVTDIGILALENLSDIHYHQKRKGALLDVPTGTAVLEALAQFHALSLPHLNDISISLDSLTAMDKTTSDWEAQIYPTIVRKIRRYVLPFSSNETRTEFEAFLERLSETFKMVLVPDPEGFNILLHGDVHYYNMMLKKDTEKNTIDCKLIDFQWSRRGSPILDLMEFITTSMAPDVFEMYCEKLFTSYLNAFHSTLKELNPSGATKCAYGLKELLADFDKYKICFMYYVSCMVPVFWSGQVDMRSADEKNDIDPILSSSEYQSFFEGWRRILLPTKNAENGEDMST